MTGRQHHAIGGGTHGEPFGPYEVYERLGVGGMATVHRAVERGIEGFERVVALKRLLPHLAEDADFVRSFVREAKLASGLQHINICQLYELGRVGSVYFISMEYIEGRDVRQVLRQARRMAGPPPIEVTVSILAELCDALDYAHDCTDDAGEPLGLVHRDVSPSNLLLAGSGHVKIIDFGIAKATSQKLRTQTGRVKGKLAYMSPEAIRGASLDARSDIFSVGVIAHELLTASPLFASKNDYETLTRIQQTSVEPPSTKNPKTSSDLDAIVLKALAKNPDDRFSTAGEFRDALDELRMRHQLNATNRAVRSWVADAFAGGVVEAGGRTRRPSDASPVSRRPASASPVAVSPVHQLERARRESARDVFAAGAIEGRGDAAASPAGSAARPSSASGELGELGDHGELGELGDHGELGEQLSSEEEVVDLAWGDDEGVPVILEEVPDVSHKVRLPPTLPPEAHAAEEGEDEQTVTALSNASGHPRGVDHDGAPDDGGEVAGRDQPNVWPEGTSSPVEPDSSPRPDSFGAMDEEGPLAAAAVASSPRRRTPTAIGMTIVSRDRDIKRNVVIGGAVAVAIGAAALSLLSFGGDSPPSAGVSPGADGGAAHAGVPEASPVAAEDARVTFVVQPVGAEILIDDEPIELGEPPHAVQLAPGTYAVQIQKVGYESWVESIEVGAGEAHVIHKKLDPGGNDQAVLRVDSTPPGLRVRVDNKRLAERTPLRVEVEPGTRVIEVLGASGAWSESFDAAADTVYSFHPVFGDGASRRDRSSSTQPATGPESGGAGGSAAPQQVDEPAPVAAPSDSPPLVFESQGSTLTPLPFEVSAPPERGREAGPRQPVLVSGSDVQRLSGEAPALPARSRGASRAEATVKLCMDHRGHVTDVDVLTNVGMDVERALRRGLRRWTFRPYVEGGERVPACFQLRFRLP